jgi:GNAT superfamily N-acetyltransferase
MEEAIRKADGEIARLAGALVFRPVSRRTKEDFVALFERPGTQRQCWCMVWRATKEEGRSTIPAVRREQMLRRIDQGTTVGLLGYDSDEPVAWVSIAPKETYNKLGGPDPVEGEIVWSLACMILRPTHRHRGLAYELIAAAVELATRNGATIVEAYPVDPESPSYRYMGFVPAFERAGFVEVQMAGSRRHVMRFHINSRTPSL